jgi:DNA-binding response OmpR family regulator
MPKILLVEDDPLITEIYEKKFSESGFNVLLAASGDEALKILKNDNVELVLLDLVMPHMSGFDVIEKIRKGGYGAGIKIIVFSNFSQKEDREKALKLGADGFIAKSEYKPSELVSEIKRYLNQFNEQKKNISKANNNSAEVTQSSQKKILMIEDEDIFIDMFGEKLKQDGYEVAFAQNGAWGVKEALKENFDLLIIDMVMPAMTGEEMVSKLKLEDKTKNIPIIMLSASVDHETVKKVETLGINGFFIKTQITPSELSNKVKEIIG